MIEPSTKAKKRQTCESKKSLNTITPGTGHFSSHVGSISKQLSTPTDDSERLVTDVHSPIVNGKKLKSKVVEPSSTLPKPSIKVSTRSEIDSDAGIDRELAENVQPLAYCDGADEQDGQSNGSPKSSTGSQETKEPSADKALSQTNEAGALASTSNTSAEGLTMELSNQQDLSPIIETGQPSQKPHLSTAKAKGSQKFAWAACVGSAALAAYMSMKGDNSFLMPSPGPLIDDVTNYSSLAPLVLHVENSQNTGLAAAKFEEHRKIQGAAEPGFKDELDPVVWNAEAGEVYKIRDASAEDCKHHEDNFNVSTSDPTIEPPRAEPGPPAPAPMIQGLDHVLHTFHSFQNGIVSFLKRKHPHDGPMSVTVGSSSQLPVASLSCAGLTGLSAVDVTEEYQNQVQQDDARSSAPAYRKKTRLIGYDKTTTVHLS